MVVLPHVTALPKAAKTKPLIHSNTAVEDLLSGQQYEGNYRAATAAAVCAYPFIVLYLVVPINNVLELISHNLTHC